MLDQTTTGGMKCGALTGFIIGAALVARLEYRRRR
jgi:hypothetical protein